MEGSATTSSTMRAYLRASACERESLEWLPRRATQSSGTHPVLFRPRPPSASSICRPNKPSSASELRTAVGMTPAASMADESIPAMVLATTGTMAPSVSFCSADRPDG